MLKDVAHVGGKVWFCCCDTHPEEVGHGSTLLIKKARSSLIEFFAQETFQPTPVQAIYIQPVVPASGQALDSHSSNSNDNCHLNH